MAANPVWAALGGAFVGGLVSEIRQWLQEGRGRRRTLRRVLHSQMDVWFKVLRSDPDELINALTRVVAERLPADSKQARLVYASQPFRDALAQLMPEALPADLVEQYERAVARLAEEDPILAHQLSGRTELAKYVLNWKATMRLCMAGLDWVSEDDRRIEPGVESALDRELRRSVLETLEGDILDVAKAISWRTRLRAKRSMAKTKKEPDEVVEEELSKSLDAMLATVTIVPRLST